MTATGTNPVDSTTAVDEACRTRPGTPMIGPYSTAQMDDFYAALGRGEVKPTGVMNLLQRLVVAQHCRPGDQVVDVCCGRGLQLPVLARYRPDLGGYTGLDISADNVAEARSRAGELPFPAEFLVADVAQPWPTTQQFDLAVYTSALEHLPSEAGRASLQHISTALVEGGRLILSTPNTPGPPPRPLQHRVHVYEWAHEEVLGALQEVGLSVDEVIGILPPSNPSGAEEAVERRFGPGGAALYRELERNAPPALLGPIVATALGDAASELLYICTNRRPA